ncbi:hypothetical protein PtB15_2B798 [Puccinia triticina]|nr:hypothetical protein PtB15_2B798 [Puccinia triticina]
MLIFLYLTPSSKLVSYVEAVWRLKTSNRLYLALNMRWMKYEDNFNYFTAPQDDGSGSSTSSARSQELYVML